MMCRAMYRVVRIVARQGENVDVHHGPLESLLAQQGIIAYHSHQRGVARETKEHHT